MIIIRIYVLHTFSPLTIIRNINSNEYQKKESKDNDTEKEQKELLLLLPQHFHLYSDNYNDFTSSDIIIIVQEYGEYNMYKKNLTRS